MKSNMPSLSDLVRGLGMKAKDIMPPDVYASGQFGDLNKYDVRPGMVLVHDETGIAVLLVCVGDLQAAAVSLADGNSVGDIITVGLETSAEEFFGTILKDLLKGLPNTGWKVFDGVSEAVQYLFTKAGGGVTQPSDADLSAYEAACDSAIDKYSRVAEASESAQSDKRGSLAAV